MIPSPQGGSDAIAAGEAREGGLAAGLPVATAAVDVAGQIRERSPADLAIFGEGSARLVDRFAEPETGQALLARAVTDGSAETTTGLVTAAGRQRFRIGLWRQRGGERVRLIAAFSAVTPGGAAAEAALGEAARAAVARLGEDMRVPLAAILGFADLIRSGGEEAASAHASSILAAAWRLLTIAEELERAGASGSLEPSPRMAEVDIGRLGRRVVSLAQPAAGATGAAVTGDGLPEPGDGPSVLGDEGLLWSVIDHLVRNALRHGGAGTTVRVGLGRSDGGLVLEVADDGRGLAPEALAEALAGSAGRSLAYSRELARRNGAALEIETAPGEGFTARLVFPASRCLDAV